MVGTPLRIVAKLATAVALCLPAVTAGTTAHAANGLVDTATFEDGLCLFEGVLPDASGACVASLTFPLMAANASVSAFSSGGTILEPSADPVTLSFTGQEVQLTPSCMGCPGAAVAYVVGQATDEGVSCPLVGTLQLLYTGVGSVVVVSGNLTWEGC